MSKAIDLSLLEGSLLSDREALLKKAKRIASRQADGLPVDKLHGDWSQQLQRSQAIVEARKAVALNLDIPPNLPLAEFAEDIRSAVERHQIVIVAGETGSGKTTQLPKLCLSLQRGIYARIAHTQPRRLAAKTVARRLAAELGQPLGEVVGYQVRFDECLDSQARVSVMTDGLLLAQLQRDPLLLAYDTIILDEAHERSLNIDFLLGCLRKILTRRSDLKLIVTSATVDVQRFYHYFSEPQQGLPALDVAAPITVPGRRFPIDTVYLVDDEESMPSDESDSVASSSRGEQNDVEQWAQQLSAVFDDIERRERAQPETARGPRDILFFLPGEREIRELRKLLSGRFRYIDVLPLYARLGRGDQERVFVEATESRPRRVILATNIAETSLTVPGIRYVVDAGLVRISRFDPRRKIQRLLTESVAKAGAEQRAGRCGRLAAGVNYRLYAESEYALLADYAEPELLRTNLASVILQMKALGLGDIQEFPFLDAPDARLINAGLKSLQELGALNRQQAITKSGRWMASLPVDPHMARMLWEAKRRHVLPIVTIIVSGLVVPDIVDTGRKLDKTGQGDTTLLPKPVESTSKTKSATKRHQSEFIDYVRRWVAIESARQSLSGSAFRRRCKAEGVSLLRLQEWRDLHRQLLLAVRGQGDMLRAEINEDEVQKFTASTHIALMSGLLRQIARKGKKGVYHAAANQQFYIHPSSTLFERRPVWIVAAQLQETSRLYARTIAEVDPKWVIEAARDHLRYRQAEPYWSTKQGRVMCKQSTSLWGLMLEADKAVPYDTANPVHAHQIFIDSALASGEANFDWPFWQHNIDMLAKARRLEAKQRAPLPALDHDRLSDFYQARIPETVNCIRSFRRWYEAATDAEREALKLTPSLLWDESVETTLTPQFPDQLTAGQLNLPLMYYFEPGSERDGVTVRVQLAQLPQLVQAELDWLVPGLLRDKCIEMLKSLPKAQRRQLVPIPALVDELSPSKPSRAQTLMGFLIDKIKQCRNIAIDPQSWHEEIEAKLSDFYRMRIEVVDSDERLIASGRSVELVKQHCSDKMPASNDLALDCRGDAVQRWDFDRLPESQIVHQQGIDLQLYPSLHVAEDGEIYQQYEHDIRAARYASYRAVTRLLRREQKDSERYLKKTLFTDERRLLPLVNVFDRASLLTDVLNGATIHAGFSIEKLPRSREAFVALNQTLRSKWVPAAMELEQQLMLIIDQYQPLMEALGRRREHFAETCRNIEQQLSRLIYPGFVEQTPFENLQEIPRYLRGIYIRLEKLSGSSEKDREFCQQIEATAEPLFKLIYHYPYALALDEQLRRFRWLLEEWHISLFAQQLGTAVPVSQKRIQQAWTLIDLTQYPESQLIS